MGFLDRLLGREQQPTAPPPVPQSPVAPGQGGRARTDDERAIERYRYLLRTAPPDQVEQAHAEAFAKLTPEQRRQVLTSLNAELPENERAQGDDPQSLARTATRAEVQRPGTLERSFGGGGMGGGIGLGGIVAGSLLASVAGSFVGTAIAGAMLNDAYGGEGGDGGEGGGEGGGEEAGGESGGAEEAGGYGDTGGEYGGGDYGGGDFGGDFGGGDFGGGEF